MPLSTKRHEYQLPPPNSDWQRSPCPALNALANHGYINRNGKNINVVKLVDEIHNVYNLSKALASLLAGGGLLLCGGDREKFEIDLHNLALHNRIEHDYSLVHADVKPGETHAPTVVDNDKLKKLLNINDKDYLTEKDLIEVRRRLIADKKELDPIHSVVASGEICMIMDLLGKDVRVKDSKGNLKIERQVPKDYIKVWMGDEKLPPGKNWEKPSKEITFQEIQDNQKEYKNLENDIRKENPRKALATFLQSMYGIESIDALINSLETGVGHPLVQLHGALARSK